MPSSVAPACKQSLHVRRIKHIQIFDKNLNGAFKICPNYLCPDYYDHHLIDSLSKQIRQLFCPSQPLFPESKPLNPISESSAWASLMGIAMPTIETAKQKTSCQVEKLYYWQRVLRRQYGKKIAGEDALKFLLLSKLTKLDRWQSPNLPQSNPCFLDFPRLNSQVRKPKIMTHKILQKEGVQPEQYVMILLRKTSHPVTKKIKYVI